MISTGSGGLRRGGLDDESLGAVEHGRLQLLVFFGLAFAITWAAQIPADLHAHEHGYALTNEANVRHLVNLFRGRLDPTILPYLLLVMFAFGPALAGIIVTAVFKGRSGLIERDCVIAGLKTLKL